MIPPPAHDRLITAWLEEQAPMREPDGLLEAVTTRVARTRRLPGPVLLERWLPMQTRARFGAIPRTAVILATLALLAALLTVVAIGAAPSRDPRLPAPFGPARNGSIISGKDGDLYLSEPGSLDATTPFIAGPETDAAPTWVNDGSLLVFDRTVDGATSLMVADSGGGDVHPATDRTFTAVRDWWPSPDGRFIAVVSPEGAVDNLTIIAIEDGATRSLPLGTAATTVTWSPDGERLLVTAKSDSATDLYLVPVNGDSPTLLRTGGKDDFQWLWYAPDGQRIAYSSAAPDARPGKAMRVYVANADGTGERVMEVLAASDFEMGGFWSPDGTRLIINVGSGNPHTVAIVSVDTDDPPVMSDGFYGTEGLYMIWAPDGESVMVQGNPDGRVATVDATTGETTVLPWKSADWPSWQRLAP